MFSRFHKCARTFIALTATGLAAAGFAAEAPTAPRVLRVAADPNNLPFSNERGEGFENKIVELVAKELGATVEYTWWAQRRHFFRDALRPGRGDVVAGIPAQIDEVLATRPYYRSGYVLVTRTDRGLTLKSLDDPALRTLRIGVQLIGDDFANTPPAHALSRRGIVENVRGYTVYGDYREKDPPARIIDALVRGEIDVAFVWGPLAGYFAQRQSTPLTLQLLPAFDAPSAQPLAFDIAMGVRRGAPGLRDELDAVLARKKPEIDRILASYGVPRATEPPKSED
jgi:mxaJ protein